MSTVLIVLCKRVTREQRLQRSPLVAVEQRMRVVPNTLLQFACLALLTACASDAPVDESYGHTEIEIQPRVQCGAGQVAVCIDVNCDPAEYVCAEKRDLRGLFDLGKH